MVFIVRDDTSTSDLLFQTSDLTWQAYNNYGGFSLYGTSTNEFDQASRAFKVSYNRPFATRGMENGVSWIFNGEYPMIRWLEANGYNVSYITGVDTARYGSLLLNHKVFMSVGHDEYWAGVQRANVEAARNDGVNLAFFSGNTMFWKTRWENSVDGSNTAYRTLVCYKETHANAKIDPSPEWTGTWRDPRLSPPADGGRPENAVKGNIFMINGPRNPPDPFTVPAADGKMRFWRNTSIATLASNQTATLPAGTLGYEWDVDLDNGFRPAGLFHMSTSTIQIDFDYLQDYGTIYGAGTATHSLTLYRHSSGALVFDAGTVQWSWGLDSTHEAGYYPAPAADVRMQQATVNLFADMLVQPATLRSGLVGATASTDMTKPASTITSPAAGANFAVGSQITVSGTATDTGGGVVGGVEVSVDGGTTWHPASGRASWSYTWTPATSGAVTIKSRAVDDSGNLETPSAGVTITVGTPDTTPPAVTMNAPANGATVSGATVTVSANASDNQGVTSVQFLLDGGSLGAPDTVAPYSITWDTTTATNGSHTLSARASDASNNTTTATNVTVTVSNVDATPPTVTMTAPANGATVSGASVTVSANASDNVGVTSVQFLLDGVSLGAADTSAPYSIIWDTTTATNGSHALSARASDAAGNTATATGVTVTVSNVDATPPTVTATTPTNGATGVSTLTSVTATFSEAIDPTSVSGSTFELRDAGSNLVAATLSYDAASKTATLAPTSLLANSTTYNATLKGGTTDPRVEDLAGNALAANLTWSFTTMAPAAPTVTSVSPNTGTTAGGTNVTITGTNFASGATVTIGGTAATNVTVVSATSITATTPPNAAGAVNVVVTNPSGQSGTLTGGYIYAAPPTVTGIAPTAGTTAGGTSVTITGTNFASGATVTIGGTAATNVTVVSATSLTARTPPHAAGVVDVVVTNSNGLSGTLAASYTYSPPPIVTNINPAAGPTAGGMSVTITGTNFAPGATVTIGGTAATNVTVVSATSITATAPAHAAGAASVVVTNPSGLSGTLANGYTYRALPTIASVNPTSGKTAGGTIVTITGTNFVTGATVSFGGIAATNVNVGSATSITATAPAGAAGNVDVTVTTAGGSSNAVSFSYVVRPVGDDNIQSTQDSNSAGVAEAFQYTANASGNISTISIFINANNSSTRVNVGLYSNNNTTNNPATLLTQATIINPVAGAWNTISVPTVAVTSGTRYWIAVLSPATRGTVRFRDVQGGGRSQTSAQTNLLALPVTWTAGTTGSRSPMSAYGQ
jgi:hypothetical protein